LSVEGNSHLMRQRTDMHSIGDAVDTPSPLIKTVAWSGAILFVTSLGFFVYSYAVRFGADVAHGKRLRPIVIDVALFSVFALHHSLFARTPFKAWVRRVVPPVLERSLYTSIASVLFVVVCWWWQPVPGVLYRLEPPWRWVAFAVQLAGILFPLLGARALDALDLAGVRQVLLHPGLHPTAQKTRGGDPGRARTAHVPLTTSGVYGIVRHPLYFGWALLVCGAATMTATRAVFAIVSTAYCAVAIPWEERALVETFGSAYDAYRRKVRWKMLPGIY
jgi:protein-S-isoprenylcysteine O-methyltransferase Ste14